GMSLPGNGTIVATHKNRSILFEKASNLIVQITKRYYEKGDTTVLPRSIATREAFLNAMTVDIAMGGSTNTVLHLLAIANEAEVDFKMKDIDDLSRKVPTLCKVSPSSHFHIQDVNRAGGVLSIMGELDKIKLLDTTVHRIDSPDLKNAIKNNEIIGNSVRNEAKEIYSSGPGLVNSLEMGSQDSHYKTLDTDRTKGCIRNYENAYNKDGGLAVLYGNIAKDGCIVKTAGVDPSVFSFRGKAKIYESQEASIKGILNGGVKEGDVVVIRYEGPKGGPGMQEMLYPTSYIKSKRLDKKCALITDGRFSGGTSGLSIGHISPEAAAGGELALLKDGDPIEINILKREINVVLSDQELANRKKAMQDKGNNAYKPENRNRKISKALKAYALLVSSADKGSIRII
ncbi:MAG: dihydroxy-acid dehydratase, partial [Bacteroidetes bacterium]